MSIIPVLMSGGVGTRLWPLSRRLVPKQLRRIAGEHTMIQATVKRLGGVDEMRDPIVVAGSAHAREIESQLAEIGHAAGLIVAEPTGRNTAPAVALAAMVVQPDDLLVVLPADHVIRDVAGFHAAVELALGVARTGRLVTFGIVPTHPATGYGYIRASGPGSVESVEEFVEKPDLETAQRYVASGAYRWNSGMFVFPVAVLLEEMERYCADVVSGVRVALDEAVTDDGILRLGASFTEVPSISIDHAVMEHTDRATVVALDAGWTDVGSWDAVWEIEGKDHDGNVVDGDVFLEGVTDSLVRADARTVAVIGLSDVIIVETEDAVLVAAKDRVQEVKAVVERLASEGRPDVT